MAVMTKTDLAEETVRFSMHGRLGLEIPQRGSMLREATEILSDVFEQCSETHPAVESEPRLELRHAPVLGRDDVRELQPGLLGGQLAMVDADYLARISRDHEGNLIVESPVSALEWLMWGMQLMLLRGGSSFIHCAGLEKNGRALLFPSWGGVGKTALAADFVRKDGWRLLGDDLVILSAEGQCYSFPKAMVLYPYHRTLFPEIFTTGAGPAVPNQLNHLLTRTATATKPILRRMPVLLDWARRHNPQSVRVAPSLIFGENALAQQGELRAIVWIDRDATISAPKLLPADDTFASRIMGSTMREFDRHCVSLTPVLCGLGLLSFEEIYAGWARIVTEGLAFADRWMVLLPRDLPVTAVPEALKQVVAPTGLFEEFA